MNLKTIAICSTLEQSVASSAKTVKKFASLISLTSVSVITSPHTLIISFSIVFDLYVWFDAQSLKSMSIGLPHLAPYLSISIKLPRSSSLTTTSYNAIDDWEKSGPILFDEFLPGCIQLHNDSSGLLFNHNFELCGAVLPLPEHWIFHYVDIAFGNQKHSDKERWSLIFAVCLHYACFHHQKGHN